MSAMQTTPIKYEVMLELQSPKEQSSIYNVVDEARDPSLRSSILTLLQLLSNEGHVHVDDAISHVSQESGVHLARSLWAEAAYWRLLAEKIIVRDGGDFISLSKSMSSSVSVLH